MFNKPIVLFVSLSALFAASYADVTSLPIPAGVTAAAWEAVNLGSGGGSTTWRVGPGKESGGLTPLANQASFTVIEGPSQVNVIAETQTGSVNAAVYENCDLSGDSPSCTLIISDANGNKQTFPGPTDVPLVPFQIDDSGSGGGSSDTSSSAATSGAQSGNGGSGGSHSDTNSGLKVLAVGGTIAAASVFAAMGVVFGSMF